jgi:hypothetical protein
MCNTKENQQSLTNEERQDLHCLYSACVEDLKHFKSQQWSITNYTLLSYGGIYFFASQFMEFNEGSRLPLPICVCLISISALTLLLAYSCYLLNKLQDDIQIRRDRLKKTRKYLSSLFMQCWETDLKSENNQESEIETCNVLQCVLSVAYALLTVILLFS